MKFINNEFKAKMYHRHGLRVGDEVQLKYSTRSLYEELPVTYSDIDCKDLRGLITYKVKKVGKGGNSITLVSPITKENKSISVGFIREEFLRK